MDVQSNDPSLATAPRPRAVAGWVLYDLANTVFTMGVVTMLFPLWLRGRVGATHVDATLGVVTSVSMGIIFVLAPILGSMTDRARRRLPFLTVSTVGCVAMTLLIGRAGLTGSLLAFVVANALYQAGLQFYDALLPSVSTPATRGRIGGLGVGIGYVGSFLAVGVLLAAPQMGWSDTTQFTMLAGLFVVFALPCFAWVDEVDNPSPGRVWSVAETRRALARTWHTLRSSSEHASLRRFLIGRLFYTDPVNTVIMVMTLYAINVAQTSGVEPAAAERIAKLIMFGAIVFAVVGGLTIGRLVDRFGARRVLAWVLGLWCVTFTIAASLGLFAMPWQWLIAVSAMAGTALGGTWAADRPLMLELTPPDRLGEFYGLYGMVGRFSAVVGPLLWASSMTLVQGMGGSTLRAQGFSVLLLLALTLVAVGILRPITRAVSERGAASARRAAASDSAGYVNSRAADERKPL